MSYATFRSLSGIYEKDAIKLEFYRSQRMPEKKESVRVYIYRQICSDFLFNTDYEEFKYSLDFSNSQLIYEGVLNKDDSVKYYEYFDYNINEGVTYAYYIKSQYNEIIQGPVIIKVRNRLLWMPYEDISNKMNQIKNNYPLFVNIKTHGKSVEQRKIKSITIGNVNNIKLGFIGLIHAGESGPEILLYVIEKLLSNNLHLLKDIGIAFLLNANPDQRERLVEGNPWYLRKNSNGVDINRNFESEFDNVEFGYGFRSDVKTSPTYRGQRANSQPETIAIIDFVKYIKPEALFMFHSLSSICTDTFLISKYCEHDNKYIDKCKRFLIPYTKGFGVKEQIELYYATSYGSLAHMMYEKYNIPAFDMELGKVPKNVKDMIVYDKVTVNLMDEYKKKHYNGICEVIKNVYS